MQILRGVSLEVPAGSMTGLIGRNGAGKTTLMKSVMGLLKASQRQHPLRWTSICWQCRPTSWRALGIGYMPEDRRLIPDLTVEENVLRARPGRSALRDARARLEKIYELRSGAARVRAAQGRCSSPAGSRSWPRSAAP